MESSNLPVKLWYEALYLVCNTKKGISACELQRQLGLKRNEPAWYMLHKIRKAMARINEVDHLSGEMQLDDAFFTTIDQKSTIPPKRQKDRSKGTCTQKALIMIESDAQRGSSNLKTGRLRMLAVESLERDAIWELSNQNVERAKRLRTIDYRTFKVLDPHKYEVNVIETAKPTSVLPWLHTAIGNIKRLIRGIYHHISTKFTQLYFDEFVFKFNYRNSNAKWNTVLQYALTPHW